MYTKEISNKIYPTAQEDISGEIKQSTKEIFPMASEMAKAS